MKKRLTVFAVLCLILSILAALGLIYYKKNGNPFSGNRGYDRTHHNPDVTTKQQIDAILNTFEKVSYSEVDKTYLKETKSNKNQYKKMLKNGTYYKVPSDSILHKIVGKNRIRNFIPKDKYYKSRKSSDNKYLYWLLDKRILYKVLALQDELEKLGHNRNAFYIRSGYRHPHYNDKIGGATRSQHLTGKAVDISVQDINQDGKYTNTDKKIVLKLAEDKIIKNEGGVGLYPGTRSVHLDVRGHKARWNSYSRK